jgi:hypothetical protein
MDGKRGEQAQPRTSGMHHNIGPCILSHFQVYELWLLELPKRWHLPRWTWMGRAICVLQLSAPILRKSVPNSQVSVMFSGNLRKWRHMHCCVHVLRLHLSIWMGWCQLRS